jgi:exodeoxyribonuclease VII small subunit
MTVTTDPTTDRPADAPIATMPFDEALAELQRTVAELEAGGQPLERCGQPLERSLALYERGVALHKRCAALLSDADLRVQQLVSQAGGTLAAVDVRPEDATEE